MKKSLCILAAVLFQFAAGASSPNAGNGSCKSVSGPFTSTVVSGAECESPVGICTLGVLTGNFHALYEFTMLTLVPVDPTDPTPTLFTYTGVSVITLRSGEKLYSTDTGFMDMTDMEAVPFETTANIIDSTGRYKSGQIVATGILNLTTGVAVGTHAGEICKEKKNQNDE